MEKLFVAAAAAAIAAAALGAPRLSQLSGF